MNLTEVGQLSLKINSADLAMQTRQLATLLAASSPLDRALQVLSNQAPSLHLQLVWARVLKSVIQGCSLSQACAQVTGVFSRTYLAMLKLGEATGNLDETLLNLSSALDRNLRLQHRLRSALTYPVFVFAFTLILTLLLFLTIVPSFVELFRQSTAPLPVLTRILVLLVDALKHPAFWLSGLGILIEARLLIETLRGKPEALLQLGRTCLSVPVLGRILMTAESLQFARTLSTGLSSGMTQTSALDLACQGAVNPAVRQVIRQAEKKLAEGISLAQSFRECPGTFHPILIQFLDCGDETGQMTKVLVHAANLLEEELDTELDSLTSLIEPFLILFVASIVGFVLLSIFLPIYGSLEQLQ